MGARRPAEAITLQTKFQAAVYGLGLRVLFVPNGQLGFHECGSFVELSELCQGTRGPLYLQYPPA